eukprot:4115187-Prymnesium_polylepis.2
MATRSTGQNRRARNRATHRTEQPGAHRCHTRTTDCHLLACPAWRVARARSPPEFSRWPQPLASAVGLSRTPQPHASAFGLSRRGSRRRSQPSASAVGLSRRPQPSASAVGLSRRGSRRRSGRRSCSFARACHRAPRRRRGTRGRRWTWRCRCPSARRSRQSRSTPPPPRGAGLRRAAS